MATTEVAELEGVHETARFIAFTDAAVAVAITMLVLPLTGFEIPVGLDVHGKPLEFLLEYEGQKIVAFILTFYTIAWFWTLHFRIINLVRRTDNRLVQLNFCWLALIVIFPVLSNVFSGAPYGGISVALALFDVLLLSATGLLLLLMARHIARHHEVQPPHAHTELLHYLRIVAYVFGTDMAILAVLAFFIPGYVTLGPLLFWLIGPLATVIFERRNTEHKRRSADSTLPPHLDRRSIARAINGPFPADRLKNFVDAVVAVAITLLILPLSEVVLPKGPQSPENPFAFAIETRPELVISFLVSFSIVAWYWLAHHRLFSLVHRADVAMMRLTLFWLAGIVALPFATEVVSNVPRFGGTTSLALFYIGFPLFLGIMLALMGRHMRHHPELLHTHVPRAFVSYTRFFGYVYFIYSAIVIVVAFFSPRLAQVCVIGLFAIGPISAYLSRRQYRKRHPSTAAPAVG